MELTPTNGGAASSSPSQDGEQSAKRIEADASDSDDEHKSEAEGVDGEAEDDQPPPATTPQEEKYMQKREQRDAFQREVNKYTASKDKKDRSAALKEKSQSKDTLRSILAQNNTRNELISSVRAYQTELFEKAKTQNTIAVLDTGSGKTLIAILLLKDALEKEMNDRQLGEPRRLAFFLVLPSNIAFQDLS